MKYYIIILSLISLNAFAFAKPSCTGCAHTLEGDELKEAEKHLNESLTKLDAGDGPSYKLVKVYYATSQVVSGSLHKINADLKDKDDNIKRCDIKIWSQPWLPNGIEVTFDCPGEATVVKKHSA